MARNRAQRWKTEEPAAANGLLHRRAFLTGGGAAVAAAITGYTLSCWAATLSLSV